MHTSYRVARPWTAALISLLACTFAYAQQTFTPKTIVQWGQGGDRERAMLTQMGVGDLAQGQFGLSVADLNGDGRPEIVVLSMGACDNTGCPVTAIQNAGAGKVNKIFSQRMSGRLAITNEVVGGYNAFAAADPAGAIMKDASGRQAVFPLAGAQLAAAAPQSAAPAAQAAAPAATQAPAARAAAPAAAPAAPSAAAPAPGAPRPVQVPQVSPERLALLTGADKPDWRAAGVEYLPTCMFQRCLSPRVLEKSGVGSEKATARAEVSPEDAARWCASYRPRDSLCAEGEVGLGGSDGMIGGRDKVRTIEANCLAGTMRTMRGRTINYAGTWDEGPGKGRPRFASIDTWDQPGLTQLNTGWSLNEAMRDAVSGEALAIHYEILCGDVKPR